MPSARRSQLPTRCALRPSQQRTPLARFAKIAEQFFFFFFLYFAHLLARDNEHTAALCVCLPMSLSVCRRRQPSRQFASNQFRSFALFSRLI